MEKIFLLKKNENTQISSLRHTSKKVCSYWRNIQKKGNLLPFFCIYKPKRLTNIPPEQRNQFMNLLRAEESPTLYHPLSGALLLKKKKAQTTPAGIWISHGLPTKKITYQIQDPLLLTWWTQHGTHQLNYTQASQDLTTLLANSFIAASHGHPDFLLLQEYSDPKNSRMRAKVVKALKKTNTPDALKHLSLLQGNQTFFGHYPEGIPALSQYIAILKTTKNKDEFLIFGPNATPTTLEKKTIPILWKKSP